MPIASVMQAFVAELRRRKVFRVVAFYAIFAWLLLQIGEVTFEPMGVPAWAMRALIIVAVTGFPIAFILAWVIDLTPRGLFFDLPLWHGSANTLRRDATRTDTLLMVLLLGAVAAGGYLVVAPLIDAPSAASMPTTNRAPANSIAVMAFDDFGDKEQASYFAGGLAEEILSMLSTLRELSVAARSSSFRLQDSDQDVREIARVLGVANILDGSVRQSGDRFRVAAYLTNGETGFQIWSKTYDAKLEDVISIQKQIASAVVSELNITLSADSTTRLQNVQTSNPDAYVYYLQAREKLRSTPDVDVLHEATGLFKQALAIDRSFARAHAGLCEAYLALYQIGRDSSNFQLAEAACGDASRAGNGGSSDVYIALGTLYRVAGRLNVARVQLDKAIALTPRNPDAFIELGEIEVSDSRVDAAEAAFLQAVTLQPGYWRAHEALAYFYYQMERYREALNSYEVLVDLTPDSAASYAGMGAAYWMLDESDLARDAWDRSLSLKPTRAGYTNAGLRYYYAGQFEDAVAMQRKALEIAPQDHRLWGRLAESYRFLPGSEDQARDAYTRAAALANEGLAINATDWSTLGLLAIYYSHLERENEAVDMVQRAVKLANANAEVLYFQSLVLLKAGNIDGALDALEASVVAEPSFGKFISTDPDMATLGNNPRFKAMVNAASAD